MIMQAKFSDDGTLIIVSFSSEGSPSSGLLDPGNVTSGNGPGSCVSILDAASVEILGDGATCENHHLSKRHKQSETNLTVLLGIADYRGCKLSIYDESMF